MFSKRPGLRGNTPPVKDVISNYDYARILDKPQTEGIHSRIVGSTFVTNGQAALAQFYRAGKEAFDSAEPRFTLFLRAEPDNPYDTDAIAVWVKSNITGKEQQLGHIQNSERKCPVCGASYEKVRRSEDAKTLCSRCGSDLIRAGLASTLNERARRGNMGVAKMFRVKIDWESGGVTGGQEDTSGKKRSWGCNILIEKIEKDK